MIKSIYSKLLILLLVVTCGSSYAQTLGTPIAGPSALCENTIATMTDATPGGVWSSPVTAVAVIGSITGTVTAIHRGTATITYTVGGLYATKVITVLQAPSSILTHTAICNSSIGLMSDAVTGGTWVSSNPAIISVDPATGIDTAKASGIDTIIYTLSSGCTTSQSFTVYPLPSPDTLTGGGIVCNSDSVHIRTNWSTSSFYYQLYRNGIPIGSSIFSTGGPIDFGLFGTTGIYTATVKNASTGCTNNLIDSVTITTGVRPAIDTVLGGGAYCAGAIGDSISVNTSGIGINYRLYLSGSPVGSAVPGTGTKITFGVKTTAGTYIVTATDATSGCKDTMYGSATIVIAPLPTVYTLTGSSSYCYGDTGVHIYVNPSQVGVSYQLFFGPSPLTTAYPGTTGSIDFGLRTLAGHYVVRAMNVATGCADTMIGFSLAINPLPPVDTITAIGSYCSGTTGDTVRMRSSTAGIRYQLFQGSTTIGGPVAGSGSSINLGAQTAGTYYAIATNNITGCRDTMYDSVRIVSIPSVTPSVSTIISPGDTVCPGGHVIAIAAIPVNGGTAPTYLWRLNRALVATGPTYTYIPTGGDTINVTMASNATCAIPSVVTHTDILVYNYVPPVTGPATVCLSGTATLTDATGGGTWSSSDPSVATVATIGGSVGVSSGIKAGTATLTYSLSSGCFTTTTITVLPLPVIYATQSASCGTTYQLSAAGGAAYTWSPSTGLYCDTCDSTTANITTSMTYSLIGTDTFGCAGTTTVSLNGNRIYGHISFAGIAPDTLDMKVWLIQYNPTDSSITAFDSTNTCTVDSSGYYEFDSKPAGNYMVKAKLLYGNVPGTSGYIPTYGAAALTWNAATTIAHTSASDSQDIVMQYGTVPAGPGFISGYVYSGAGKGTSGGAAAGMTIYLRNLANNILTYVYTDPKGAYIFQNLAYGDYVIYPEAFDYKTIPSNIITLNSDKDSATNISFMQLTTSKVIRPFDILPAHVSAVSNSGVIVFPNPSKGDALNIKWQNQQTSDATLRITDITGRSVFGSTLYVNEPSGIATINISDLEEGIYIINITSGSISYSGRLQVQR